MKTGLSQSSLLAALACLLISTPFACDQVCAQARFAIRGGGGGFTRSVSVTNENGVKTTRVVENGKKFVIREGQDSIEVEFANTYGPNDMEKLKEKHPDLHMHVTSFPKTSGNAKVELTISVKEKVKAKDPSELQEKSEAAYKIYEKYSKKNGGIRFGGGVIELGGEIKELGIDPFGEGAIEIVPDDFKAEVNRLKAELKRDFEKAVERKRAEQRSVDRANSKQQKSEKRQQSDKQEQKSSSKKKLIDA